MNINKLVIVLCLFPFLSTGQISADTTIQLKTGTAHFILTDIYTDRFATDNMGQIYLANDEEILKLNSEGDILFIWSDKSSGQVDYMDVNFALKPLIFFKDQNSVQFLDNTLTPQSDLINLGDYDIYQPLAVSNSFAGNTLWVYSLDNFELYKLSNDKGIVFRSGNLVNQIDMDQDITELIEYKNNLYANCPETGILKFDIFGSYLKTIPIKNARHIQIFDNHIIAHKDEGLWFYNMKTFKTTLFSTSVQYDWIEINASKLYTLKGNILSVYKINL